VGVQVTRVRERRLRPDAPANLVFEVAPLGFRDANEADQARWAAGYRRLLDRLRGPLQVVLQTQPGHGAALAPAGPQPHQSARQGDLAFVAEIDSRGDTEHQRLWFVTPEPAAQDLEVGLRELGATVRSIRPAQVRAALDRVGEAPGHVQDAAGFHRTWALVSFPVGEVEVGWIWRLLPPGARCCLAWHAMRLPAPWAMSHLQRRALGLEAMLAQGEHARWAPVRARERAKSAEGLRGRIAANEESAFHVSAYLTVSATSEAELNRALAGVESHARAALCSLVECRFRQLDARASTLPLGIDRLHRRHLLPTSALLALLPWRDAKLRQARGVVVGRTVGGGDPVLLDPFSPGVFSNANIGVFGHSGSGKTHLLSTLALGLWGAGIQVLILDPEHEYGALARAVGGVDVALEPGSGHALNVFDELGAPARGAAVADAVELCTVLSGGLDAVELAQVEAAVRLAAEERPHPLLADVVAHLSRPSRAGTILERWAQSPLGSLFSRPSNVDLNAGMVVFGMREMRPELVPPVHFLLAHAIWSQIKLRRRRRVLMIDELGLLFADPIMRDFIVSLARRVRKYDASLIFATQNPGDLLSSEAGAVVASNPDIHFFGAQRPAEAARLESAFGLSPRQRQHLERARRGDFLLSAATDRLLVHVEPPPWQAELMRAARANR